MSDHYRKVKSFVIDLNLKMVSEDASEELVVVDAEDSGIKNLIIDCEDPILILEQAIFKLPARAKESPAVYRRLLEINRELVHGAFVIDAGTDMVLYRDTLQLANLDLNELEGSVNALSLGLAEFGDEILEMAR